MTGVQTCALPILSIPGDLSIISFNNSLLARLTSPQLTSIDVNSCQLGIEAASQIINHMENPNLMATKIIVPHRLVERDSGLPIEKSPLTPGLFPSSSFSGDFVPLRFICFCVRRTHRMSRCPVWN